MIGGYANEMNILQYFHKKEVLPIFNIGDKVKLKKGDAFEQIRKIYNKYYPNCYCSKNKWHGEIWDKLNKYIGEGIHIVTKLEKGTPAAGDWFVYIDNQKTGYHGNIFELIKCE